MCSRRAGSSRCAAKRKARETGCQVKQEIDRRYKNIRSRMEREGLDALIVCGNQYAGFEGAVRFTSPVSRSCIATSTLCSRWRVSPRWCFRAKRAGSATRPSPGSKTMSGPMFPDSWIRERGAGTRMEARRRLRHEFRHGRARLSRTDQGFIRTRSLRSPVRYGARG